MNIPDINVYAIVLIAIAVLLIFLVVLVFLGAREHNDRFDQTWRDHYRKPDNDDGGGGDA